MRSRELIDGVIKAYDVRGIVGETLDAELAHDIGAAFGAIIRRDGEHTLAIAHDMRDSGPALAKSFSDGARSQGIDVTFIGLSSVSYTHLTLPTIYSV